MTRSVWYYGYATAQALMGIAGLVVAFKTSMPDAWAVLYGFLFGVGGAKLFGGRR